MNAESHSVIANQQKLGTVNYHKNRLSFHDAREWQAYSRAFPLSVSMPLSRNEHSPRRLLPSSGDLPGS